MRAVDTNNIVRDESADGDHRLVFKHSTKNPSFPAARFDSSVLVRSSETETREQSYPGIPLSPERLNIAIQNSELRFSRLELEFASRVERDRLKAAFRDKNLF
jgi:hypothetical protein